MGARGIDPRTPGGGKMTIKLAYPTVASPTALVTLDDVENFPSSRPRRKLQRVFDTDAGSQVVYDYGDENRTFSITLYPLTTAEAGEIEDFFRLAEGSGGVNGRAGEWQFYDTLGDTYDVRFAQDVIDPIQVNSGIWRASITMRTV